MTELTKETLTWTSASEIDIGCSSDRAAGIAYWMIDDVYTASHQQHVIHRRPPTPNVIGQQPASADISDTATVSSSQTQSLSWAQLIGIDAFGLFNPTRTIVTVAPDRCVAEKDGSITYTLHPGDYANNGTRCMYTDDPDEPLPKHTTEFLPVRCEFGLEIIDWTADNNDLNVLYHQIKAGGGGEPVVAVHITNNNAFLRGPDGMEYSALSAGINHFVIETQPARDATGWYRFYHNGVLVKTYTGANMLDAVNHMYISRGEYRPAWNALPYDPLSYMRLKEHYYREANYEDFT